VDDQHVEIVTPYLRHQFPAAAEMLAAMPRRGKNLAHQLSLVNIVIEYGDSHGGGGEMLIKIAIVNHIYQVSIFLTPK
jgi:hypothetical protein